MGLDSRHSGCYWNHRRTTKARNQSIMNLSSPQVNPQEFQTLIQEIGIRYTEVQPTHTPNKQVEAWMYFNGSNYFLYIWANGGWRIQQIGAAQAQFGVYSFFVTGGTLSDSLKTHDFGFVPKIVMGVLTPSSGAATISYMGIWHNGQEQLTSMVTDGGGASSVSFLGADSSFYVSNLSVAGNVLTLHYKNTGSTAACFLWAWG